ncbi:MAG: rhomboid family intramembrane serine protease [Thermosphaera aggregans]
MTKVFTSMTIHAEIFHIFFNMYFLQLFGSRLKSFIRRRGI